MIVIGPPRFDLAFGLVDRQERVGIEALIPQSAVEGFDQAVLHGLSGPDEVKCHATPVGPFIKRTRGKLGAVINGDRLRFAMARDRPIEGSGNSRPGHSLSHLQDGT